jgi:hypothetical protein
MEQAGNTQKIPFAQQYPPPDPWREFLLPMTKIASVIRRPMTLAIDFAGGAREGI